VEEGIEILTGVRAGTPNAKGLYPRGTVFGEVQEKLRIYIERDRRAKREARATAEKGEDAQ
jgi:hypothetical protein